MLLTSSQFVLCQAPFRMGCSTKCALLRRSGLLSIASGRLMDQYTLEPIVLPVPAGRALAARKATGSHCAALGPLWGRSGPLRTTVGALLAFGGVVWACFGLVFLASLENSKYHPPKTILKYVVFPLWNCGRWNPCGKRSFTLCEMRVLGPPWESRSQVKNLFPYATPSCPLGLGISVIFVISTT